MTAAISWLISGRRFSKVGAIAFWAGVGLIIATFAIHLSLLVTQQYEYQYTFHNTQRDMPFIYRISAAWASQEGSFLLWTLMSAGFAAIVMRSTGTYRRWFTIICSLALLAMLSILAYESPFRLLELSAQDKILLAPGQTMVLPPDGMGLNPTLQNYWMVIHPWVIFLGFGSLLSLFSWAGAAVITRNWSDWVSRVRPYAIFSMTVLGVGLTMGGLWAYETLGWGGFWAWDPVENVSLVPFIATTVLVHGLYVQGSRGSWAAGNLLLGMLPFLWFVYGTYLTRSGALVAVSVHSFAKMNEGAHGWLLGMVLAAALTFIVFAISVFRKPALHAEPKPRGDRQPLLGIGVALLYGIGIMAAIGMSIPFLAVLGLKLSAMGDKSVVSETVYNRIIAWPFVPALLGMAVVPFLGWTRTASERWQRLSNLFFITVLLFGIISFFLVRSGLTLNGEHKMPSVQLGIFFVLMFVCIFSIVANGARIFERTRAKAGGIGAFLTHAGVSTLLLGLIVSHAFEKTQDSQVSLSFPTRLALVPGHSYIASLESLPKTDELTHSDNTLKFKLVNDSTGEALLFKPNFYYTPREGQLISRPYIIRSGLYDLYFVVGSPDLTLVSELSLKPGETKKSGDFLIKYVAKTQKGQPGMAGTRFGAQLVVTHGAQTYHANPELELGGGQGPVHHPVRIGEIGVVTLDRLLAADNTAVISILPPEPIFPIQMFFKPLTTLVWLGAGMMTVGGILAVGKRRRANHLSDAATQPTEIEDSPR